MKLILASASPRRRELLRGMGVEDFEIRPSAREASFPRGAAGADAVVRIALGKGADIAAGAGPGDLVIAADTLVFLDGAPLGKPRDAAEAAEMLRALSGREHQVITGLAIIKDGAAQTCAVETAVRFRPLTQAEIDWYVSTGEPMDKAGAYGIQGLGGMLVESIRGDYFNVVGLPVARLAVMLREAGYDLFTKR